MIDTNKMLDEIIEKNKEFNQILDANQKGYVVKYVETNQPEQFASYPGYKVISSDEYFTKVRVFLRTEPLQPFRLKEKPRDIDRSHFVQITYKDGKGGMVINRNQIKDSQFKKIINAINKI